MPDPAPGLPTGLTRITGTSVGIKALWIAFGAAAFYVVGALAVPIVIVMLRNSGVGIAGDTAIELTRLAALLMGALGGAFGLRHAQRLHARRSAN